MAKPIGWSVTQGLEPIVRVWSLRTLVRLGAERDLIGDDGFRGTQLARLLGLADDDHVRGGIAKPHKVRMRLREMLRDAEEAAADEPLPRDLSCNLERLCELIGVCEADRVILAFAILLATKPVLARVTALLGELTSRGAIEVIGGILGLTDEEVSGAISPSGRLSRSGLLRLDTEFNRRLDSKLDLLSGGFADAMMLPGSDPLDILRETVTRAPDPLLRVGDYEHLGDSVNVLLPYLRQALASGQSGVNVLLHGAPGTGKTELCRVLAREVGADLYEISSEDEDGDAVAAKGRLMALRAAQSIFRSQSAILVFDEIEDVFTSNSLPTFGDRSGRAQKAWLNRALESNPRPTFWLSNSLEWLDPACIRRFDVVVELPIPLRRQRERIIRQACESLVDEATIKRLASDENLSPGVIARAARVVGAVRDHLENASLGGTVESLVAQTLRAQGHRKPEVRSSNAGGVYDLAFLNADVDLTELVRKLSEIRSGRICLFGPPGMGKSAFARWVADHLDKPLLVRRASDLLGAFVGDNEKQVATAFQRAREDDTVLLIDEVEGFLLDRRGARHGWEQSMVNEMLVQMEGFKGIFFSSTNMLDVMDLAALRQFDVKVRFDYLRPDHARELLRRHSLALGLGEPCIRSLHAVGKLDTLTPGDFVAMARRSRLTAVNSPAMFVAALTAECRLKDGDRLQVGFAAV